MTSGLVPDGGGGGFLCLGSLGFAAQGLAFQDVACWECDARLAGSAVPNASSVACTFFSSSCSSAPSHVIALQSASSSRERCVAGTCASSGCDKKFTVFLILLFFSFAERSTGCAARHFAGFALNQHLSPYPEPKKASNCSHVYAFPSFAKRRSTSVGFAILPPRIALEPVQMLHTESVTLLCIALHCFALHLFALLCIALHCFALHCFELLTLY